MSETLSRTYQTYLKQTSNKSSQAYRSSCELQAGYFRKSFLSGMMSPTLEAAVGDPRRGVSQHLHLDNDYDTGRRICIDQ